jgi:hypothetical protein
MLIVIAPNVRLRDPSIPTARQGLDVPRLTRAIVEKIAKPAHRCIDAMIEINDGVMGPELLPDFLPGHNLPGMFQQQAEDLKRLFGEKEPSSALVQFASSEVQPIRPKVNVASPGGFFHFFPSSIED